MTIETIGTREAREAEREEERAPYGYKADGTPRKRPAPRPRKKAKPTVSRTDARSLAGEDGDLIGRTIRELDERIVRLTAARDALKDLS